MSFLTPTAILRAQTAVDGAITGTVEDSSGAAIPNATVLVHSTATNADASVTSDASGYFHVSRLVPGDYTVQVRGAGFADYTANHVIVEVGKSTEVVPRLNAGGTSTTVEVSAEAPVINSENSDFTSEFTPTTLKTLPINGRHWTSFALLSPGVTLGNSAFGLVTFRGATNLQNNFMVDGSDDNDSFDSVERGYTRVGYSTTEDSILEFQVLTSNVSAQYGRAVGGGVNAITRSGSNQFHGDLFEYWRDNDFGATNPFNILQTIPKIVYVKPKDKRHQFGGSFSGPAIKDRLFFFYAIDQQLRNFPILAVPTPQFLQDTNAAYNNCKIQGTTTTTDAVTCAEDRGVTAPQIASAMSYFTNQSGIASRQGNQLINFGKIDYKISNRNTASMMYNRMRWNSPNGTQTNPVVRRGITSLGNDYMKIDSIIGKIDTFLTPRISNELRVEYAKDFGYETGDAPLSNEPTTTAGGLPPGVTITTNSGFNMGSPYYVPRASYPKEEEADIVDNVAITRGSQTFNIGGEFRWAQDNITDVDYEHGLFTYTLLADWFTDFARTLGSMAGCDSARDTGTGTLPCYSNLQQAFGHPTFVYHTNDIAGYAQDDWKMRPSFTLNLGVRYDYEQTPSAKIPNSAVPQTSQLPSDRINFAPRVGFAWDAYKNGKTLFHGGFGMYFGRIQNGTIYKALSATGSPSAQFQLNSSPSATSPIYPNIVSTANPPAVSNITAFASGFKNPFAYEADFSVQQSLGWNTVLGIAYLGSFGRQLPTFVDANIAPATTTKTYSFVNGPLAGDKWTVPVYTARVNPAYNALTLISSTINSNYNALSVTLDHRLSQGVAIQASYTYSKALDNGMNQSALSDTNDQTDPFTTSPDYGRSANDMPQRVVGSLVLAPKFNISNRLASETANGWSLSPVWTLQSGIPYSFALAGGTSIPGGTTTFNGSGGIGAGSGQFVDFKAYPQYASADVFATNVFPYRNSARQTAILDVDSRLSRTFSIREKYNLMLAAESFNLLNHQNFTAFNTTAYTLSGTTATYQASFGTPSAAGNTIYRERQIQFVGRFEF
ncbi:MAG TPA: TonB-dependent receptor [Terracidiphilus sp.]|nr:TonB-dependent receptor [Terracidiphilus sp.]